MPQDRPQTPASEQPVRTEPALTGETEDARQERLAKHHPGDYCFGLVAPDGQPAELIQ